MLRRHKELKDKPCRPVYSPVCDERNWNWPSHISHVMNKLVLCEAISICLPYQREDELGGGALSCRALMIRVKTAPYSP
jgi:hypothetical protein